MEKLQILNLAETKITGKALTHLAKAPALGHLDVSHTQLKDADFAGLASAPQLRGLTLKNVMIGPTGLGHLVRIKSLTRLDLSGSKVTVELAEKFQATLPRCRIYGVKGYNSPR